MKCIFYCFLLSIISFFSPAQSNKPFILVIDAGHGGKDSGAYGYGGYEKNIALSITQKLGRYIEQNYPSQVKVIYTRKTDVFIPLRERANIANRHRADLFISIHCNATPRASPEGTETYILGMHRSEDNFEVAKRENSVIFLESDYKKNYQGFDPNSPKSVIGFTLIQNAYLRNSIEFAKKVEEDFLRVHRQSRGVKQAGLFVNREVSMPSVLIEVGFITNPNEGAFLASSSGQEVIASAIYKAFSDFKSDYEAKNNLNSLSNSSIIPLGKGRSFDIKTTKSLPDKKYPITTSNSSGVAYTIDLLSLSRKISMEDPFFQVFQPVFFYKEDNLYKYIYGNTSELKTAKEWLVRVRNLGFFSAFILAVKNGIFLNKTQT